MVDVRQGVEEVITRVTGVGGDKLVDHAFLWNDLGIDQLERWEISALLEKRFEVIITEEEVEEWETLDSVIDCIQNKVENGK